mmetsp:Transcript_13723/g.43399  ORF Transcript_13723/g.43399 Transcript_13723/m.43399 type:complete len:373 (-) Transcript_13723:387-1505(-)
MSRRACRSSAWGLTLLFAISALPGSHTRHGVITGEIDIHQAIWNEEPPLLGPTVLGTIQDCTGAVPAQAGKLCGANGAFTLGHYVYVTAAMVHRLTVIDVYRPLQPSIAGSIQSRQLLKQATQPFVTGSGDRPVYAVVASRGESPGFDGHVTVVDVSPGRWYTDDSGRWHVEPVVLGAISDCKRHINDPTLNARLLLFGTLCSARAVFVTGGAAAEEDAYAFVAAEYVHTLTIVEIPSASPGAPRVIGSVRDALLLNIRAVAVKGETAYAVSDHCSGDCLVTVNVANRLVPVVSGTIPLADWVPPSPLDPGWLGMEHVARGDQDSRYAYVVSPYSGKVRWGRRRVSAATIPPTPPQPQQRAPAPLALSSAVS